VKELPNQVNNDMKENKELITARGTQLEDGYRLSKVKIPEGEQSLIPPSSINDITQN